MAGYWLCPRGLEDDPFPSDWFHQDTWREENTRGFGTGIRGTPRIKPGDQIVWYAVKWRVLYGLAEVTGRPEQRQVQDWQGDRWPWYIPTRTRVVIADLSTAPTPEEAGPPLDGCGAELQSAQPRPVHGMLSRDNTSGKTVRRNVSSSHARTLPSLTIKRLVETRQRCPSVECR
jgi:hypothetical protein